MGRSRILFTTLLSVLLGMLVGCEQEAKPLPEIAQVPQFALTSQSGETLEPQTLEGHPWVANFIFTRCPTICPTLTSQMRDLQTRLADTDVRFVSFSVDPKHDTPEVLRRYAEKHGADLSTWSFLTGPLDEVEPVVVEGFKQMLEKKPPEPDAPAPNILHGSHFVLIDASGTIRGYYTSNEEGMGTLAEHARRLGEEESPS